MNWVFQQEGIIDHYNKDIHTGTQPVRVVHHMLMHMFQNTHPGFLDELKQHIKDGKLNREFGLVYGEESIRTKEGNWRTPRVSDVTRKIELHETFLSYLWSCTYAVYVIYLETVDFPKCNRENGSVVYQVNKENISKAKQLFDFAKLLVIDFEVWDKNTLPNPEVYRAEDRTYVEQANCLYTEAVKFVLCHELAHLTLHIDKIGNDTPNSNYLAFEEEADAYAINTIKQGLPNGWDSLSDANRLVVENGIVLGLLSMFFFSATTTGLKHPNTEDRLTNVLEKLDLKNNEHAWGIACVGLQMWDEQFGLEFEWEEGQILYKEQYFQIVRQIKARQR